MSEWINVKDRLPQDKTETIIIFSDGFCVYFGRYYDGDSFDGEPLFKVESSNGHIFRDSEVTHWMPLPEPPNE